MVRFLLENSLGAWWAARHPTSPLVGDFEYLRFDSDGGPSAGSFDHWPDRVADVTVMDPCCGSGHFLVETFSMLSRMRAEEESTGLAAAQDAVLRENLFGLDLDPRCVQLSRFALALHAWKTTGEWRTLPTPAIACSGIEVAGQLSDWKALSAADPKLDRALETLHRQFRLAMDLGSLIDPRRAAAGGDLFDIDYGAVAPLLEELLRREHSPESRVAGWAAADVAAAAALLSRRYTLVATNVPYLGIQRLPEQTGAYLTSLYPLSANDLATAFIERCLRFASTGSIALVTPLSWLYLRYFGDLRKALLDQVAWNMLAPLGKGAFGAITGHVVQSALIVFSSTSVDKEVAAVDATSADGPEAKSAALRAADIISRPQEAMRGSPDTLLALETATGGALGNYADSWQGLVTGDVARFTVKFWEVPTAGSIWEPFLTAPRSTSPYVGRTTYLRWERGAGALKSFSGAHNFNPEAALGRGGVLVAQMGDLPATLYSGEMFNDKSVPLVPDNPTDVAALWAYCSSEEFRKEVRQINHSMSVGNGYFLKIPFDVERWRTVAEAQWPSGLPAPTTDDPTQWLFQGQLTRCAAVLQVAVARLLGYRWPDQAESDELGPHADRDGIVCLPPVAGEPPAAERLSRLLAAAFPDFSMTGPAKLLQQAGSKKKTLTDWLRDEFFKQHCALFSNRPFIWHVWDGQRDGFSALVNYHRLDRSTLEKLTYTYLGQDWVERQRAEAREDLPGADGRLSAALALQRKLEAILEGEAPYDIYVRWKPIHRQPVGWEPDLNDGVRPNVRPFVTAGVLRSAFNIHWRKDRGKNPDGSERENDLHLTMAEKPDARQRAGHA